MSVKGGGVDPSFRICNSAFFSIDVIFIASINNNNSYNIGSAVFVQRDMYIQPYLEGVPKHLVFPLRAENCCFARFRYAFLNKAVDCVYIDTKS